MYSAIFLNAESYTHCVMHIIFKFIICSNRRLVVIFQLLLLYLRLCSIWVLMCWFIKKWLRCGLIGGFTSTTGLAYDHFQVSHANMCRLIKFWYGFSYSLYCIKYIYFDGCTRPKSRLHGSIAGTQMFVTAYWRHRTCCVFKFNFSFYCGDIIQIVGMFQLNDNKS